MSLWSAIAEFDGPWSLNGELARFPTKAVVVIQ
jgi:hypothetical protein